MEDDFNVSLAFSSMHELITLTNNFLSVLEKSKGRISHLQTSASLVKLARERFQKMLDIFGIRTERVIDGVQKKSLTDDLIQLIVDLRNEARREKNFKLADKIRQDLNQLGFVLEDTPSGTRWRKANS
jgi:cysteinyl-tRNA synthetase